MGLFGIGSKPKISTVSSVGLTEQGKRVAEKYSSQGVTFVILSALSEQSPQTVKQLADSTQIEISELKKRLEHLAKSGLVRFSSLE